MKVLLTISFVMILLSSSLLADGRRVFFGEGRYHDGAVGRFSYLAKLEIISDQNGAERLILREVVEDGGSSTIFCFLLQPSELNHVFSGFKVLAPSSTEDCDKENGEFAIVGWGHRAGIAGKEMFLNIGNHGGWSRTSIYLIENNGEMDVTSSSVGKDNSVAVWFLTLKKQ